MKNETKEIRFFYGYAIVAASLLLQAIGWGTHNSFGVFFNPLLTDFEWSRTEVSGAASISYLLHGFAAIALGRLSDRFGPRLIMTWCGFILALGYVLMSQVSALWHIYLFYGLFIGIGISGTDVVLLSTIARWFVKKRGMMSGIIKVGTGLGMVIMPPLINKMITVYGWRISFTMLSILLFLSFVSLAQLLVRDPAKKGLLPDNEREVTTSGEYEMESGLTFGETIRTRQFWTVCMIYMIILFCTYTILMHIVPHAIDLGISSTEAANVISIIGAVSIAGRIVMGGAGDRIGNKAALIICFSLLIVALCWLQFAQTLWLLYFFAVIQGFGHGGFFALISPTIAGLFGTVSHGVIFGIVTFSGTIGGAIGPLLAGYLFDVTHSYRVVFLTLAAMSVFGLISTLSLGSGRYENRNVKMGIGRN